MAQRSETVLNDWAAGLTPEEIAQSRKIRIQSVIRYIVAAAGAAATPVWNDDFLEELDAFPARSILADRNSAALATLIKVHGHPSRVTTLQQAGDAFRRRDGHPCAAPAAGLTLNRDFGDPPPGRSALDQRRAG